MWLTAAVLAPPCAHTEVTGHALVAGVHKQSRRLGVVGRPSVGAPGRTLVPHCFSVPAPQAADMWHAMSCPATSHKRWSHHNFLGVSRTICLRLPLYDTAFVTTFLCHRLGGQKSIQLPCHVKKHVLCQPGSARDEAMVPAECAERLCPYGDACSNSLGQREPASVGLPRRRTGV